MILGSIYKKKIKDIQIGIDEINKTISSREDRIKSLQREVSLKENIINERNIQITNDIKSAINGVAQQIMNQEFFKQNRYSNDDMLLEYKRFEGYVLNNLFRAYDLRHLNDLKGFIIENRYSIENFFNRQKIGINFDLNILVTQLNEIINSYRGLISGAKAEEDTRIIISTFDHKVKYLVNHRCCARKTQDENVIYAENDIIIVCQQGIFTLEIKNSSSDLMITSNGDLVRTNSGKRDNIVEQCLRHVNITQRVLEEELGDEYPQVKDVVVEPLIIIANNAVELKDNCKRVPVLIKSEIQEYILSTYQPKRLLTEEEVDLYFNTLKRRQEEPAKFKHSVNVDILNSQLSLLSYYVNLNNSLNNFNSENQTTISEIQKIKKRIQEEKSILNEYKADFELLNNELLKLTSQRDEVLNTIKFGVDVFKSLVKSKVLRGLLVIFLATKVVLFGVEALTELQSEKLTDKLETLRQSEILNSSSSLEEYERQNLELIELKNEVNDTNKALKDKLEALQLNKTTFVPGTAWTGTGTIEGKEIAAKIVFEGSKAIFYFESEDDKLGSFSLMPIVDKESGYIKLTAMEWINPRTDFNMFDLVGLENQGIIFLEAISGKDGKIGEFKFIKR
ncbi:Nuclease-related domain [Turicibacter sanguinis]|nr:Nuclease-related domain [Turicibacter sanguinis]